LRLETHDRHQKGKQASDLVRFVSTLHDLDRRMRHVSRPSEMF
jgi:hypothetical protein